MITYFDSFSIEMTKRQAESASHSGQCDNDVDLLLQDRRITRQLDKINPDDIRAELKEYGAWDEVELQDDTANRQRIIWIAAGNIADGSY